MKLLTQQLNLNNKLPDLIKVMVVVMACGRGKRMGPLW
jgi:hypothetical protein